MDLSTRYLGLELKNPVIVGSSGLTASANKIKDLEAQGAGAVVLKSIYEEEVGYEYADFLQSAGTGGETHFFDSDGRRSPIEYYNYQLREDNLNRYLDLVKDSKAAVSIPVIASINCFYHSIEWTAYAAHIEQAGADALELNMFFPPSDFTHSREEKEKIYFQIIETVRKKVSIPIALKISYYFTDLGPMILKLSDTGVNGIVLFNRFFSPDFDIDKIEVTPSFVFSAPSELAMSLRWIAIMAAKVDCDLAASTGVHDGTALIKQLLAGASAVQVVSSLYKNGAKHIGAMLNDLEQWMARKGFDRLAAFKGKLSQDKSSDPSLYERAQFMRYFGGKKNITT